MANTFNHNGKVVINDSGQMSVNTISVPYVDDKLLVSGGNIIIENNRSYLQYSSAGARVSVISLNSSNNISVGQSNVNHGSLNLYGGTGVVTINAGASEVARFTTAGNVGIGTTSPNAPLHIVKDLGTSVSAVLRLRGSNSTARTTRLQFEDYNGTIADGLIDFIVPTAGSSTGARLDIGVDSVVMSLVKGGNVGIGTTSPAQKLHVVGAARFDNIGSQLVLGTNGVAGAYEITTQTSNALTISLSGVAERMRITSAGNVGIGTTSPTNKLTIQSNSTQLRLETASDPGAYYSFIESNYNAANPLNIYSSAAASYAMGTISLVGIDGVNTYLNSYYGIVFGTSASLISTATVRMMITNAGNVGIGTTNPNNKLDVRRANSGIVAEFHSTAGTPDEYVDVKLISGNTSAGTYGTILRHQRVGTGGADFAVLTNPTLTGTPVERFRITRDGNVGIGTTAPSQLLHINASSGAVYARVQNNVNSLYLGLESGGIAQVSSDVSSLNVMANTFTSFENAGSERMRITSAGNVGIGTTSPSQKLHVQGNSIVDGQSFLTSGFSSYTTDGLFNANALWSGMITPSGVYRIRFGYFDQGGGQYWGRIGFVGNTNWSLGTSQGGNSFSIGTDNGNNQFLIDNAGNVGIGTTAPSTKLEVGNFLDAVTNKITVAARYEYEPEFNFRLGQSGTNLDWVGAVISSGDDGNYNGKILFKTANAGRDTPTTKMVIKANGNVGIGTTAPAAKLHLSGTGATELRITSTTANTNSLLSFYENTLASWGIDAGQANGKFYIKDLYNTNTRLTIDASGNVGIGTTSPTSQLHVQSSSPELLLYNTTTAGGTLNFVDQAWQSQIVGIQGNLLLKTGGTTERVRITNDGNVGIGTTSPGAKLHVESSNNTYIKINSTVGTENVGLHLENSGDATHAWAFYRNPTGHLQLTHSTGATVGQGTTSTRMWVDTNGNVGIGTTAPDHKLHVVSSEQCPALFESTTSGGGIALMDSTTTNDAQVGIGAFGNDLCFRSGGSAAGNMRLLANGNFGIGTTSPSVKLHVAGSTFVDSGFLYMSSGLPIVWGSAESIEGSTGVINIKTASTSRIYINSTGDVGVGTTSPTNRLTVTTATNAVDVLRLNNTGGDSGSVQGVTHLAINHFNSGTNPSTRITAYQDSTSGWPGGMYFSTRSLNTDSAPVERMRITSAGNVGIGTTSPQYMLDVNGDAQINAAGTGPAYAYVPDGGFGVDSLITSGTENVALGKPDVWLRIHVDGVAFVFPGYQEPE